MNPVNEGSALIFRWISPDGKESLRALCLVSHQTLPSAQRALYRRPFADFFERRNLWRSASILLHTLEKEGGLGRLVRETKGIQDWLGSMHLQGFYRNEPTERVVEWYLWILQACPRLEQVDLRFQTEDKVHTVLQALHLAPPPLTTTSNPAVPSIRSITLTNSASGHVFNVQEILEALKRSPLFLLDTIEINQASQFESRNSTSPQLPFPVKNIKIKGGRETMDNWFGFFPRTPSTLEHFSYAGPPRWKNTDLTELSSVLGTNLQSLSLVFRHDRRYGSFWLGPSIPLTTFASLPQLTILTLCNTHGPSLPLLETLLQFSPLLSVISFNGSRWVDDSNPLSKVPDELFPSTQIIRTLRHFRCLRSIDLGHLPTRDALKYTFVKTALHEQGIAVLWDSDELYGN